MSEKKKEKDMLIESIAYLNTKRGFNPAKLFEAYKRLNKINICQNIYELCPKTMDPRKIHIHWCKSYVAFCNLKPKKEDLQYLKNMDTKIRNESNMNELILNVYSYKEIIRDIIFKILQN